MSKWERPHVPPSHCCGRNKPSFSSSLLDAIYRSIDDSDSRTPNLTISSAAKNQISGSGYKHRPFPLSPPRNHRSARDLADDGRYLRFFSATRSSDSSSFGGFSSSDADSTATRRPVLTRSDRIRCDPVPIPEKKSFGCSILNRIRDLRKPSTPASPRARFASFLNAIFSSSGGSPRKPKLTRGMEEPTSSSASSYPRSTTSKAAPSSKSFEKQGPILISPMKVSVSEHRLPARPCGFTSKADARDRWRMFELTRGFEKMDEERESVSSSELFELDSLSVVGRFTDELPVYETTNLDKKAAPSPAASSFKIFKY